MNVADTLQENTTDANAGSLMGNRMFYDNDYMARIVDSPAATIYSLTVAHSRFNVALGM
jgi:hypothetical protein